MNGVVRRQQCFQLSATACALALVSCVHTRTITTTNGQSSARPLPPPADIDPGTPDPAAPRTTPVYASDANPVPEYPGYALKAGCRNGLVPVRIYIGADGNVTDQQDIPERPLPTDQCHLAFRAAVQGVVKDWKFAPAFRKTPLPGRDLGDGKPPLPRWEQHPVPVYVDYEFSFLVVNGKGVVRSR